MAKDSGYRLGVEDVKYDRSAGLRAVGDNTDLGAPGDANTKKKTFQTPAVLNTAAELANTDLGAPALSGEDRDRVFKHEAQPYFQKLDDQRKQDEKYFESMGLRWSGDRRETYDRRTEDTYGRVAEDVMVPLIKGERAERRQDLTTMANIGMIEGQLGIQEGQLGIQGRAQALDELNSEYDRAVAEARETGMWTDPETQEEIQTLAAKIEEHSQSISERKTTLLEQDQAIKRAQQRGEMTGRYYDPKTNTTMDTLQAKRDRLNEIVQEAVHRGYWGTDITVNLAEFMADMEISPSEYQDGEWGGAGGGDESVSSADRAEILRSLTEDAFRVAIPGIAQAIDFSTEEIEEVVGYIGYDDAFEFFDRFMQGDNMPVSSFLDWAAEMAADPSDVQGILASLGNMVEVDWQDDPETISALSSYLAEGGLIGDMPAELRAKLDGYTLSMPGAYTNTTTTSDTTTSDTTTSDNANDGGGSTVTDEQARDFLFDLQNRDGGYGAVTQQEWDDLPAKYQQVVPNPAKKFENDVLSQTGSNFTEDQIHNAAAVFRGEGKEAAIRYLRGFNTGSTQAADEAAADEAAADTTTTDSSNWRSAPHAANPGTFAKNIKFGDGSKVWQLNDPRMVDIENMVRDGRLGELSALYLLYDQGKINHTVAAHLRDNILRG